jgi:two-component system response regulator AtoC
MKPTPNILVVDDDKAVRTALKINLTKHGMNVHLASHPSAALEILAHTTFELVLSDVRMPGATGIDLLKNIRESWPATSVIMMTGYGSVQDAVQAMRLGAADYLIKPVEKDELLIIIERVLERNALQAEVLQLRKKVSNRYGFQNIIGHSQSMTDLFDRVVAVADTRATVLIQGPTGTGKELLAHAIHYRSSRATRPFVRVNCAAIPDSLIESELFGHEKGSFTGATRQHRGKFEQAHTGTILLDEIGEVAPHIQVKLLRILENGELQRVGGSSTIQVDVRVISATNKDLYQETINGSFRTDLYYRLNVMALQIPALKNRRSDIPLLADHFLAKYSQQNDRKGLQISSESMQMLANYSWPGNVRELEHVIERAVILSPDSTLQVETLSEPGAEDVKPEFAESQPTPDHIKQSGNLPPPGTSLQEALAEYERAIVIEAMKLGDGVQARAARRLGVSRSNLNYRIQKLGIQLKSLNYE